MKSGVLIVPLCLVLILSRSAKGLISEPCHYQLSSQETNGA